MIDGISLKNAVLSIGTTGIEKVNGLIFTHKVDEFYYVRGSLHKYNNKGLHNADDFYLSDLKKSLNLLNEKTGLNPETTVLNGFEIGVNIKLQMNPNNALKCIILHKTNTGNWEEKRDGKVFGYDNYTNKFYNKSARTKEEPYHSENILRIEVSIDKMKHISDVMTYQKLSDLLDVELWKRFEKILIETIQDCLIIDFTDDEINQLTDKERIKYGDYINTDYWHSLYDIPKGKRSYESVKKRANYNREREDCNKFINQHSKSTLKNDILNLISVKCKELRDVSVANEIKKKWYKLPTFEIGNSTNYHVDKKGICTTATETTEPRCISCGRIIKNPRKGQLYCSAKVVGYNEAHKCRNNNSNIRNNTKRSIRRVLSIPLLFDFTDYIASDKRKYL